MFTNYFLSSHAENAQRSGTDGMLLWVEQCEKRRMKMVVVGIPKTIDNDIELLDKTFGFDTAVEEAQRAINAAYTEVHASPLFNIQQSVVTSRSA